jgi:hypothetical protein
VIGSYRGGIVNREYLYLQQRSDNATFGVSMAEELDVNRAWKTDAGERALSFTSFYGHSTLHLSRAVDLRVGFDNRRNVRLYRDKVTPETEFDDAYRQGASAGMSFRLGRHLDFGGDGRSSRAASSTSNDSYTMNVGFTRLAPGNLSLRSRSTRYRAESVEGWLHSAYFSLSPIAALYLELRGGLREDRPRTSSIEGRVVRWIGMDADLSLTRRLYLVLSEERTRDKGAESDQAFIKASLRY